jgi:hypothetical protein
MLKIGDKFTKYTKNGAFGFFDRHYFFIDHERVTFGFIPSVRQAGDFFLR